MTVIRNIPSKSATSTRRHRKNLASTLFVFAVLLARPHAPRTDTANVATSILSQEENYTNSTNEIKRTVKMTKMPSCAPYDSSYDSATGFHEHRKNPRTRQKHLVRRNSTRKRRLPVTE